MSFLTKALNRLSDRFARVTHVRLGWLGIATLILFLLIFYLSPTQFPVMLHKLALVTLAAVVGYWIDAHLFPYAHPLDLRNGEPRTYQMAMLRRALIVSATLLSIALGL